jgi:hypothetical protein
MERERKARDKGVEAKQNRKEKRGRGEGKRRGEKMQKRKSKKV